MTTAERLAKARAHLVMEHPFFGALALLLKTLEDPAVKTATCDGTTIRYNPKYVAPLSHRELMGMIAHLVMHAAFLHPTRRGDRDAKKWNIACDHAINPILESAKFELPKGTYSDKQYANMPAEHIYGLLPDEPKNDKGGDSDDPGGDGGVADSPNSTAKGASQSQQNSEEAEWKVAVAQAAHMAKQRGDLPAGIARMLDDLLEPVLPWRDILRRFMTERLNDNFSWQRGNRRFLAQKLYLPSRISDNAMGEVIVVIDTSGSIGQKELNEFGSEIQSIVSEARPSKTRVIYCDANIAHIDEFGPDDDLHFAAHGGGGTDFRPPFKWLQEEQIVPRVLVYLTDGYGPFPEEQDFPVMWVINNRDVVPPNGEHLILEV